MYNIKLVTTCVLAFISHAMVSAVEFATFDGGPTVDISYDSSKSMFKFTTSVPSNQYLGIAFGENMTNTDMVVFQSEGQGTVKDLWSTGNMKPITDLMQNWKDIQVTKNANASIYSFVAYRASDTKDQFRDRILVCDGSKKTWAWSVNTASASLSQHDKFGNFDI